MRNAYIMDPQRVRHFPLSPNAFLDARKVAIVRSAGFGVLRYGLAFLLLAGGALKFATFEAEGIRPFIEHSPFLSWMYSVLSVRAASGVIGIIELALGIGIVLRRWSPVASGIASLAAAGVFLLTWSFFFTTPGATAPGSDAGGFLMKDLILLGAALAIAAEALGAARDRTGVDPGGSSPS